MNHANFSPLVPLTEPQLCFVMCPGPGVLSPHALPGQPAPEPGQHRMAYWSWGDPANPRTLLCVHGLSRQGRDFDTLARSLSAHYHVICPDVVGRGESDWLSTPQAYNTFTYAADMVALVAQLRAEKGLTAPMTIDWVGTSMGGLIALAFAMQPPGASGAVLRRLVLNDVGPRIQHEAVQRIGQYLGQPRRFADEQEAVDYLWSISSGFGPHTPDQWRELSRPLLRPAPDGQGLVLHYDPAMAEPFRAVDADTAAAAATMLWQIYDQLQCEVLVLRGEQSDLLDPATAHEMSQRGPRAQLVTFAGVGHAPTLMVPDQVAAVEGFLLA